MEKPGMENSHRSGGGMVGKYGNGLVEIFQKEA